MLRDYRLANRIILTVIFGVFVLCTLPEIMGYAPGVAVRKLFLQRDWLNLLFGQFIHLSSIHILVNLITLTSFMRDEIVPPLNYRQILGIYLLAGFVGSIVHYLVNPHPAIGASGAVCGILILIFTYFHDYRFKLYFFMVLPLSATGRRIIYFFLGIHIVGIIFIDEIAWFAHLGGALVGFAVAVFMLKRRQRT